MLRLPTTDFDDSGFLATRAAGPGASSEPPRRDPTPYDAIVVGAGIGGLTAAHALRRRRLLVLDRDSVFGGNARDGSWQGIRYATGGTVFQLPTKDSPVGRLLTDLDLYGKWQEIGEDSLVLVDRHRLSRGIVEMTKAVARHPYSLLDPSSLAVSGRLVRSHMSKARYVPVRKRAKEPLFEDAFTYLWRFAPGRGKYPAIPWTPDCRWTREEMEAFDSVSLHDLLGSPAVRRTLPSSLVPRRTFGSLVYELVETVLRMECLSLKEVSAYVGLHYLVGYLLGSLVSYSGGNAGLSRRLADELAATDSVSMKANCDVRRIALAPDGGLEVTYRDGPVLTASRARCVVFCGPQSAAADIVEDMRPEQKRAIAAIKRRTYVIANVFLKHSLWSEYYGGYIINDRRAPSGDFGWCSSGAFVVPSWTVKSSGTKGVLTLLKPLADPDGHLRAKSAAFSPMQEAARAEAADIIATAGRPASDILDVKIWRWGRARIAPIVGQLKDDVFERGSRPVSGVFFGSQDAVGLGNLEGAVQAGVTASRQAEAYLNASARPAPAGGEPQ